MSINQQKTEIFDKESGTEGREIPPEKFRFAEEKRKKREEVTGKSVGYARDALTRFAKNKGAIVAAVIIALQLAFAIFAPLFTAYDVHFRDPYYLKVIPSFSSRRGGGLGFWDGTKEVGGGQAKFDVYDGIAEEMSLLKDGKSRAPLVRAKKREEDGRASYQMTVDSYYEVGYVYKDLSEEEYNRLKEYQNKTKIQVMFPLQNNYQAVGANQWYRLEGTHQDRATELHGDKSRYAAATKAAGERNESGALIPDYKTHYSPTAFGYDSLRLDFSQTAYPEGTPMTAPPVVAEQSSQTRYKLMTDGEGRLYYWYDDEVGYAYRDEEYRWQKAPEGVSFSEVPGYYVYAFENQSGYRVRVCYYEFFKFLHGKYPHFLFGTNQYGQDILSCLASGARLSFLLAFVVSAINLTIGALYGAVEGYYGGKTDVVMQRISEILSAVPFIVVATLFQLHFGGKISPVITILLAFVLTGWLPTAARVRAQFYRFKGQEYVLAARTLGAKDGRIIFKHVFPNAIGTVVTGAVLSIPGVIFSESMLSYLGIINFETSGFTSLGTMLSQGQALLSVAPHALLFPALFIALLEIGFNLFGNGLRDALNPALRGADEG